MKVHLSKIAWSGTKAPKMFLSMSSAVKAICSACGWGGILGAETSDKQNNVQ